MVDIAYFVFCWLCLFYTYNSIYYFSHNRIAEISLGWTSYVSLYHVVLNLFLIDCLSLSFVELDEFAVLIFGMKSSQRGLLSSNRELCDENEQISLNSCEFWVIRVGNQAHEIRIFYAITTTTKTTITTTCFIRFRYNHDINSRWANRESFVLSDRKRERERERLEMLPKVKAHRLFTVKNICWKYALHIVWSVVSTKAIQKRKATRAQLQQLQSNKKTSSEKPSIFRCNLFTWVCYVYWRANLFLVVPHSEKRANSEKREFKVCMERSRNSTLKCLNMF